MIPRQSRSVPGTCPSGADHLLVGDCACAGIKRHGHHNARLSRRLARSWARTALLGLVAALLASVSVLAGMPGLRWLGQEWSGRGVSRAETVSLEAGSPIASLCLAQPQAPTMRWWISQHPKSQRGRLDHRRSRSEAGD